MAEPKAIPDNQATIAGKKTKIVCTLGPATDAPGVLKRMILEGMNVARLNFSHGDHEEHLGRVRMVKALRQELGLPIALLLDTKGPEIRIGTFRDGKVELAEGARFTFTAEDVEGDSESVSLTYKELPRQVRSGDRILGDDGMLQFAVVETDGTRIVTEVVNGGTFSNRKSLNVPGVHLDMPYVSEKDRKDLEFGVRNGFDFVAASFTRTAKDIEDIRAALSELGAARIKIIAKIENAQGVDNIDEIIRAADGIMVARGDMGVEIDLVELPRLQKMLIRKTYIAGKHSITATQMLESMIKNPRPTRAETTDVANAVYDGTSAVMLSGETAVGRYPADSVRTMRSIAQRTEQDINYKKRFSQLEGPHGRDVSDAIAHAACTTAHDLDAAAIIVVTSSGSTARQISKYRPACPIIAVTDEEPTYRQLALAWGVTPVLGESKYNTDSLFMHAEQKALETGLVGEGELVVFTGGILVGIPGSTNTLRVKKAERRTIPT